jgi:hypothetical protein
MLAELWSYDSVGLDLGTRKPAPSRVGDRACRGSFLGVIGNDCYLSCEGPG